MSGSLLVSPQELQAASERVRESTARYKASYDRIYAAVDSLATHWSGEANQAFVAQIRGFENDLDNMRKLLDKYGEFLFVSGNNYQNAENIIITNAGTELSSGR